MIDWKEEAIWDYFCFRQRSGWFGYRLGMINCKKLVRKKSGTCSMTAVFQPMNIARAADLKETNGVPATPSAAEIWRRWEDFRHRVYSMLSRSL